MTKAILLNKPITRQKTIHTFFIDFEGDDTKRLLDILGDRISDLGRGMVAIGLICHIHERSNSFHIPCIIVEVDNNPPGLITAITNLIRQTEV